MDFLLLVFLVVFRATQGSRTCNLSDAVGTVKCSGTVGEPIVLHLTSNTTGLEIMLYKGQQRPVFRLRNNESKVYPDYVNRSKFFTNGTFWLDSAVRTDRGLYQLQIYSSEGKLTRNVTMTLQIQAPVSEPVLSVICRSGGETQVTQVTCSSEGEPVEYRWSLDSQSPSSNIISNQSHHYANITLHSHVTGSLTCDVQNDISTNSSTIQLSACSAVPSEFPDKTLTVMVSVTVAILLSLFLGVRHFLKKTRSQNVHSGGGGEKVTYAEVVVGRRRERDTPSPLHQEVVYTQVKMGVALERSK